MQAALIVLLFATVAFCVAVLGPVVFRLFQPCSFNEIPQEWLEEFTPSSYYPMRRLLSDEDFEFLARQPGFDLSLYRKLRRERLLIFRQYLRRLIVDFNRLYTVTRTLISHQEEDHSELAVKLMKLRVRFMFSVLSAECSYLLCCMGVKTIVATAMLARLEEMSAEFVRVAQPETA
jgi:hypothetical protein